jgi:hypothetical protein
LTAWIEKEKMMMKKERVERRGDERRRGSRRRIKVHRENGDQTEDGED